MSFEERINQIRRYNAPMATAIINLRARYSSLYRLDALSFEILVYRALIDGVRCKDFHTRDELIEMLYRKRQPGTIL